MRWDSALYDAKHGFVAAYGETLLPLVPVRSGQRILDLGCGTGTLTEKLSHCGDYVLGTDSSPDMVAKASAQFPQIDFQVMDALQMSWRQEWDVVFSNAVFHWIRDQRRLLANIYRALKPGGLLICEFGAHGNIATIEQAFAAITRKLGYGYESQFQFPTAAAFAELLRAAGFQIKELTAYDRPTPLQDGREGLTHWAKQFFAPALASIPQQEHLGILERLSELTAEKLWNGSEWVADYRRLRVVAQKGADPIDSVSGLGDGGVGPKEA